MSAPPQLIDTHLHLDALDPPLELAGELAAARQAGVVTWIVPGVAAADWSRLRELVTATPGAALAPGLHPAHAADWSPRVAIQLAALLEAPETVAVGEIGLDAALDVAQEVQETAFRGQLRLAVAAGLPVLIHCRRATERVLRILAEEGAGRYGGIMHAFSGSIETARAALRLNFAVACNGALTWPEARRAPAVAAALPAEWLVLESDAPDLSPYPHRGDCNRPSWLPLVAARLAEIRGWSADECAAVTTANALRLLPRLRAAAPFPL